MAIEKLDFQTATKQNIPYSLISTRVIQNIKEPIALAVWVYLSSLPSNWQINKEHLKHKFGFGNGKLKQILSYLSRSRLVQYSRSRDEEGRLGAGEIHILCGDQFDENEPYKHNKKTRGSEIEPVDNTRGSVCHPVDSQTSGSGLLQKKYKNKEKIKEQKREPAPASRLPLSFFEPNEEHKAFCAEVGIDLQKELISFKAKASDFGNLILKFSDWLNKALEYKLRQKSTAKNDEPKQTAKFWGIGHPDYDRWHQK